MDSAVKEMTVIFLTRVKNLELKEGKKKSSIQSKNKAKKKRIKRRNETNLI